MPTCNRTRKRYQRAPDITAPAAISDHDTVAWFDPDANPLRKGTVRQVGPASAAVAVGAVTLLVPANRLARVLA